MEKNWQARAEAKRLGLSRYFTGIPCSRGHLVERLTVNGACTQCFNEARQAKRAERPGYRTRIEIDAKREAKTRQCTACREVFPSTTEFFTLLKNDHWTGLSAECRECRNKRFPEYYKRNRKKVLARVKKAYQQNKRQVRS